MSKSAAGETIIVRPEQPHGWTMVTLGSHSPIRFHGRQRALHFARAYARLNPPVTLRVLGETGEVEFEEVFEDALRGEGHARRPVKVTLVALPSK
jgi:hypothetical protein